MTKEEIVSIMTEEEKPLPLREGIWFVIKICAAIATLLIYKHC